MGEGPNRCKHFPQVCVQHLFVHCKCMRFMSYSISASALEAPVREVLISTASKDNHSCMVADISLGA